MQSKKAFPLWEETKKKYVAEMWKAQQLLVDYRQRGNPRDLRDLQSQCLTCWMNIRSYRDLLLKKDKNTKEVKMMEAMITSDREYNFLELAEVWKFLNDAHKRLGIDDVGKQEDEDDYKTAVLDGLFD